MIPAGIIDDIRNRCDVESVIASYVALKRAGTNMKGLCPFHSEKTPSFTVYPGTQSFYCFGCGAGGDVISFVMRMENLDYVAAVETLAKRAGITLPDFDNNPMGQKGVSRSRILEMNLEAAKYFRQMLFDEQLGAPGRQYLADRKMSMAAIKRFGIGYAPEYGSMMSKHLRSLGFKDDEIQAGYLGGKNERGMFDYYRARVIFPIIDVSGNVIAFGGRIIDSSKSDRKYLNTSDTPAFKKTKNLYALNYAKSAGDNFFILCEGYMDVIALQDAGFGTAVASLGTAFTEEQARILKKYTSSVILCYDSDEAGQKATDKAIRILEAVGIEAKILGITGAKDPDEYIKKYGADSFRKLIEQSRGKFDFFMDGVRSRHDLSNDDEKIRALDEVNTYLASIVSDVERDIYISRAAKEFSVSPESLRNDTARRRKAFERQNGKKRRDELIRGMTGSSDRVNPEFSAKPKAARIEENLLGILFLHPEFLPRETDGKPLEENEMATTLGRRLLAFLRENAEGFSIGLLNESFTSDEVSRVARMIARRNELTTNDEAAYDECVRNLRQEGVRTNADLTLEEILAERRNKTDKA